MQLPCIRTLKYYIDANLENAGDSMERLQESRRQYVALIEEKKTLQEENEKKGMNTALQNITPFIDFAVCLHVFTS